MHKSRQRISSSTMATTKRANNKLTKQGKGLVLQLIRLSLRALTLEAVLALVRNQLTPIDSRLLLLSSLQGLWVAWPRCLVATTLEGEVAEVGAVQSDAEVKSLSKLIAERVCGTMSLQLKKMSLVTKMMMRKKSNHIITITTRMLLEI